MEDLMAQKTIRIDISSEVRGICERYVRETDADFAGPYGQTKNAIAWQRTVRALLDGNPWPDPKEDKELFYKLQQVGKFFGNASAVRQSVLEKKTKSKADEIVEDLAE